MRRLALLLAVAAVALAAALPSTSAVSPTMNGVVQDGDFIFSLTFADGTEVGGPDSPWPVIPPGTYQITVDDEATRTAFGLTGIGVAQATDVAGTGIYHWNVTFLPCVLYSYGNGQTVQRGYSFQTSASAASTTACPKLDAQVTATTPVTPPPPANQPKSKVPPGAILSADGSVITVRRGTLDVGVAANGGLSLAYKGKRASRLPAGQYTVAVADAAKRVGASLRHTGHASVAVSTASFVGKRRLTVQLGTGAWVLVPLGESGPAVRFTVTK